MLNSNSDTVNSNTENSHHFGGLQNWRKLFLNLVMCAIKLLCLVHDRRGEKRE